MSCHHATLDILKLALRIQDAYVDVIDVFEPKQDYNYTAEEAELCYNTLRKLFHLFVTQQHFLDVMYKSDIIARSNIPGEVEQKVRKFQAVYKQHCSASDNAVCNSLPKHVPVSKSWAYVRKSLKSQNILSHLFHLSAKLPSAIEAMMENYILFGITLEVTYDILERIYSCKSRKLVKSEIKMIQNLQNPTNFLECEILIKSVLRAYGILNILGRLNKENASILEQAVISKFDHHFTTSYEDFFNFESSE